MKMAELYPEGRTFWHEGTDELEAINQVRTLVRMGIVDRDSIEIKFQVPADRLDEFYALDLPVGT